MATLRHADSGPDTSSAPPPRIISGPLAAVFVIAFGTLTSFYLLLSVTPRYAAQAGAGTTGAGLVTGALLAGTVVAELGAATLMKRYRYRTLLAAAAALLGVPVLALLVTHGLPVVVVASIVRGFGFGLTMVVADAATAELLPPERRGEGLGIYGVVDLLPAVLALPGGVWLADHVGNTLVVALTAATALMPVAALRWLPRTAGRREAGTAHIDADPAPTVGLLAGLRRYGQLRPSLVFVASTVAAGVVVTFLPLAAGVGASTVAIGLLVQAVTATIGRWWAGRYGDRHGHARLLVPGLAGASLGMLAMIWLTSPAMVIAAMCVFGAAFGISQNATFALMIDRIPASGLGTSSALWNLAYDAGYGAGPAGFGLVVGHTGYSAAFALTGVLMLAALPAAWRERADLSPGNRAD
ncbi:MAG TPA: MFS transporter [Streptosporangiaceae bacterium]|nr:MFS transporter [Streptosporangiaceae bacterium]